MKAQTHTVTLAAPAIIAGVEYAAGDRPAVTSHQHDELVARGCLKPRAPRAAESTEPDQETHDA